MRSKFHNGSDKPSTICFLIDNIRCELKYREKVEGGVRALVTDSTTTNDTAEKISTEDRNGLLITTVRNITKRMRSIQPLTSKL